MDSKYPYVARLDSNIHELLVLFTEDKVGKVVFDPDMRHGGVGYTSSDWVMLAFKKLSDTEVYDKYRGKSELIDAYLSDLGFDIEEDHNVELYGFIKDDNKVKNSNVSHYDIWKDFEAIDVMKKLLTPEEYIGYLKGNILKYQLRLGKKDDVAKEKTKITDYTRELNSILEKGE